MSAKNIISKADDLFSKGAESTISFFFSSKHSLKRKLAVLAAVIFVPLALVIGAISLLSSDDKRPTTAKGDDSIEYENEKPDFSGFGNLAPSDPSNPFMASNPRVSSGPSDETVETWIRNYSNAKPVSSYELLKALPAVNLKTSLSLSASKLISEQKFKNSVQQQLTKAGIKLNRQAPATLHVIAKLHRRTYSITTTSNRGKKTTDYNVGMLMLTIQLPIPAKISRNGKFYTQYVYPVNRHTSYSGPLYLGQKGWFENLLNKAVDSTITAIKSPTRKPSHDPYTQKIIAEATNHRALYEDYHRKATTIDAPLQHVDSIRPIIIQNLDIANKVVSKSTLRNLWSSNFTKQKLSLSQNSPFYIVHDFSVDWKGPRTARDLLSLRNTSMSQFYAIYSRITLYRQSVITNIGGQFYRFDAALHTSTLVDFEKNQRSFNKSKNPAAHKLYKSHIPSYLKNATRN